MIFDESEDTEETPAEDAPEGAAAEETPEAEAPAEETPEAEAPAEAEAVAEEPAEEPEEVLPPKERKRKERSTHTGEAKPSRTIEERTAERLAKRKKNAEERRRYRAKSREKRRTGGEGTPPADRVGTGSPRVLRGIVVSDKSDKTITVRIDVARGHRTYGKIVRTSSKIAAHDERNEAHPGDTVRVVESRPLSKSKRWRLVEVVERSR
jgi:small subunit ribosomal protein S17